MMTNLIEMQNSEYAKDRKKTKRVIRTSFCPQTSTKAGLRVGLSEPSCISHLTVPPGTSMWQVGWARQISTTPGLSYTLKRSLSCCPPLSRQGDHIRTKRKPDVKDERKHGEKATGALEEQEPGMSYPPPQNPGQGGFYPVDRSMLPPAPFPNTHFPFPPGLNLFPPPPPLPHQAQDQNLGAQTQNPKRKGKKQRWKKGKNGQNAQKEQQQQQQKQQGPPRPENAAPPGAPSQPAYAARQMAPGQNGFNGVHDIYAQQPPHDQQQFMSHLQALIHSHHQPPQPPTGPAGAPPAAAAGPNGKGPAPQFQPPTGPKAKSKKALPGSNKRDNPRQAPSSESGGVPTPTQSYLSTAALPPFPSPQPRPLLVIIDLNGTLIHRPSRRSNPTNFHPRPHASPFLHYVISTFSTMIWSSAKPDNVRSVTNRLLTPSDRAGLIALWGREAFGFTDKDYNGRTQCYKRLERAWADPAVRGSHPMGGEWDQTNTVLIDDSAEKARSEPYNLVEIPEFSGGDEEAAEILPQVHTYLNTLSLQGDVSRYIRENPFRVQDRFEMS